MNIRLETPQDYREVENLTRETFWNVYRPGCTEHYVLNQYRCNPGFIPELDFVMERLRVGGARREWKVEELSVSVPALYYSSLGSYTPTKSSAFRLMTSG
ncbi:MAG: hypothetical protein IJ562_06260 [Prevotella sp.]|nr:hypothetical protein [Prevotella sp.]